MQARVETCHRFKVNQIKMKYTKICPKCGEIDVKMPHSGLDVKMTLKDECLGCGFIGNFPEVENIKEFREKLKKGC